MHNKCVKLKETPQYSAIFYTFFFNKVLGLSNSNYFHSAFTTVKSVDSRIFK